MNDPADRLAERIRDAVQRYEEIGRRMADPEVLGDLEQLRDLAREHSDLETVADRGRAYLKLLDELDQARELAASDDPELEELAAAEVQELEARRDSENEELRRLLVPSDPLDDRPAVVEIRAGTGGDEAALFAADLHRMYSRFAGNKGWAIETVSLSEGTLGGVKEVVFIARGKQAYGLLRYESGVHRVQRVPETESQGRIHTSAATVAERVEDRCLPVIRPRWTVREHDRLGRPDHAHSDQRRGHLPGREIATQEQGEGSQGAAKPTARPNDRRTGVPACA
jgi:peptide chain release factor 1